MDAKDILLIISSAYVVIGTIVRLTPTKQDDVYWGKIRRFFHILFEATKVDKK